MNSSFLLTLLVGSFLTINVQSECIIQTNPVELVDCITISPSIITSLLSNQDLKSFCRQTNQYLGCLQLRLKDCPLGGTSTGIFNDLIDLTQKCCTNTDTYTQCVVKNPELTKNCYSLDNYVTLSNGKQKRIGDIKVGESVKSIDSNGNLIDTEIVSILHKETNEYVEFLNIHTSNGQSISLTESHLIHVKTKGFIKASQVKINDVFIHELNKESKVIKIDKIVKKGYIAPMSESGTLLVNSIYSSCYAEINSHWLAHLAMSPLRFMYSFNKLISYSNPSTLVETINSNGINGYASILYDFTSYLVPSLFN